LEIIGLVYLDEGGCGVVVFEILRVGRHGTKLVPFNGCDMGRFFDLSKILFQPLNLVKGKYV